MHRFTAHSQNRKCSIMVLTLGSPAFTANGSIPRRHTCDGDNVSPPLSWSGVPLQAKSMALIVDDPDAPDPAAPKRTFVHWVVYNIPTDCSGLPEGADNEALPPATLMGMNDWSKCAYGGPCPPIGRHRYFFKLYALDAPLGDLHQPTKAKLLAAMRGRVLAEATLVGTYQRG